MYRRSFSPRDLLSHTRAFSRVFVPVRVFVHVHDLHGTRRRRRSSAVLARLLVEAVSGVRTLDKLIDVHLAGPRDLSEGATLSVELRFPSLVSPFGPDGCSAGVIRVLEGNRIIVELPESSRGAIETSPSSGRTLKDVMKMIGDLHRFESESGKSRESQAWLVIAASRETPFDLLGRLFMAAVGPGAGIWKVMVVIPES